MRWLLLLMMGALALPLAAAPLPGRMVDAATGQDVPAAAFLARVAAAPRVLLGERHDQPADHAAERALLQALHAVRPQGAVALEMMASERQPRLQRVQRWMHGRTPPTPARLHELLDWDPRWDWQAYGPLVMQLGTAGIPMLGTNLSRGEVNAGLAANAMPPPFPQPHAATRLEAALLAQHDGAGPMLPGMLSIQQARDRRMAGVLAAAPAPALLVAGRWHVLRGTGVPGYLGADTPVLVVVLASTGEHIDPADADLVWITDGL